ncbi:hypothetical protein LL912_17885 [Niabella sp. CC-SYL272]|uniref:hypothetical protein n=1 Tax=Niabella agricola TaxID=2891571 RepID=UPI001F4637CD|nr:hypothetical protein [Niabella agricola]MCF3110659.1 hypothetical protein [Niabella agricola]
MMPEKNQTTRITAAFLDYEKFKADITRMENEVAQLRANRDRLLQPAASELTDLVAQKIVDYDEQIIREESAINQYEFEMEKVVTFLESVFARIGVDKAIRVVSLGHEAFHIYRNDKNLFSREKELKAFL